MADSANIKLGGDNAELEQVLEESVGMFQQWGGTIKNVAKAAIAVFAAKELFSWGKSFLDSAMEAQEGAALLDLTIKNLGDKASMSADDVKDFAGEIMKVTKFEDDAAIAAQTLFMRLGTLDASAIKRATVASADLATVLGGDMEAASMKIMTALKSPENGIAALKQAGIKFTDEQKNMVKALVEAGDEAAAQEIIMSQLEASIGGAATTIGETASGKMAIFTNRLGDVGEMIGTAMLPALDMLMPVLDGLVVWLEESGGPAVVSMMETMTDWGKTITDYVGPVFKWFVDAGILAFTAVQTVIQNFGKSADFALTGFVLAMVRTVENVKHFFAEAMPAYLEWFGRNWKAVFWDAGQMVVSVTSNMWKNLVSFWEGVKSLFSGGGFNFEMTPLLEGFERTTEKLPEIAKRVKGEMEQGLEMKMDKLGGELSNAFAANLDANRKAVLGDPNEKPKPVAKELRDKTPAEAESAAKALAEAQARGAAAVKDGEKEKEKTDKEKEKANADKEVKATFEDLTSLGKRIAGSAAGAKDPTEKAVEKGAQKQTDATKDVAKKQDETNSLLDKAVGLLGTVSKSLAGGAGGFK